MLHLMEADVERPVVQMQLEVEGGNQLMRHRHHLRQRPDVQRLRSPAEAVALDQRGEAADVVDMRVGDEEIAEVVRAESRAQERPIDIAAAIDQQSTLVVLARHGDDASSCGARWAARRRFPGITGAPSGDLLWVSVGLARAPRLTARLCVILTPWTAGISFRISSLRGRLRALAPIAHARPMLILVDGPSGLDAGMAGREAFGAF